MPTVRKVLFIQTAFIGDAILASALWETWHEEFPDDELHVCVRKGNESLFAGHPFLAGLHIWDKRGGWWKRYRSLMGLASSLRGEGFDAVITPHRHASSGWLAWRSGAPHRVGFEVHPLRFLFTHTVPHGFDDGVHEVKRNHRLLGMWLGQEALREPRLHPAEGPGTKESYAVLTPASQWATKQWPEARWVELCDALEHEPGELRLVGGPGDAPLLRRIASSTRHARTQVMTELTLLESAGLMAGAQWVLTNDSGPLHLASAVDAPTVAVFCSTVPSFGFGPLAARSVVVETELELACRPCGLHGKTACPLGHFECGQSISVEAVLAALQRLS
jgi:heptosyltransferase-2